MNGASEDESGRIPDEKKMEPLDGESDGAGAGRRYGSTSSWAREVSERASR